MSKINSWKTIGTLWAYIGVSWLLNAYALPHVEPEGVRQFVRGVDFAVLCIVGFVCAGAVFQSGKDIITTVKNFIEASRASRRDDV